MAHNIVLKEEEKYCTHCGLSDFTEACKFSVEGEKIRIEEDKLRIEEGKLRIEGKKAFYGIFLSHSRSLSAISIIILPSLFYSHSVMHVGVFSIVHRSSCYLYGI